MIEVGYRIFNIVWCVAVFLAIYVGDMHVAMFALLLANTSQILANQERNK